MLTLFILFFITLVLTGKTLSNAPRIIHLLGVILIFAIISTTRYNLYHNPHLLLWLCNITALLGLFLCFMFHQKLFEVFFYFAWSGDLLTLMIVNNPVAPPLEIYPVSWMGFMLKHIIPLLLTIHFIKNENRRLTETAFKTALIALIGYAVFIVGYNWIFDQNILDFREPTLAIEYAFGPWPRYVIVNCLLALGWYLSIYFFTVRLKLRTLNLPE